MELIKCIDCGHQVSPWASQCPKCSSQNFKGVECAICLTPLSIKQALSLFGEPSDLIRTSRVNAKGTISSLEVHKQAHRGTFSNKRIGTKYFHETCFHEIFADLNSHSKKYTKNSICQVCKHSIQHEYSYNFKISRGSHEKEFLFSAIHDLKYPKECPNCGNPSSMDSVAKDISEYGTYWDLCCFCKFPLAEGKNIVEALSEKNLRAIVHPGTPFHKQMTSEQIKMLNYREMPRHADSENDGFYYSHWNGGNRSHKICLLEQRQEIINNAEKKINRHRDFRKQAPQLNEEGARRRQIKSEARMATKILKGLIFIIGFILLFSYPLEAIVFSIIGFSIAVFFEKLVVKYQINKLDKS